eukprot:COSAG05_NODE_1501_length_4698_cov_16.884540_1_plen_56_part_10
MAKELGRRWMQMSKEQKDAYNKVAALPADDNGGAAAAAAAAAAGAAALPADENGGA